MDMGPLVEDGEVSASMEVQELFIEEVTQTSKGYTVNGVVNKEKRKKKEGKGAVTSSLQKWKRRAWGKVAVGDTEETAIAKKTKRNQLHDNDHVAGGAGKKICIEERATIMSKQVLAEAGYQPC